jgi:hypothetical protein
MFELGSQVISALVLSWHGVQQKHLDEETVRAQTDLSNALAQALAGQGALTVSIWRYESSSA